jgi:hypothetical protein
MFGGVLTEISAKGGTSVIGKGRFLGGSFSIPRNFWSTSELVLSAAISKTVGWADRSAKQFGF